MGIPSGSGKDDWLDFIQSHIIPRFVFSKMEMERGCEIGAGNFK